MWNATFPFSVLRKAKNSKGFCPRRSRCLDWITLKVFSTIHDSDNFAGVGVWNWSLWGSDPISKWSFSVPLWCLLTFWVATRQARDVTVVGTRFPARLSFGFFETLTHKALAYLSLN